MDDFQKVLAAYAGSSSTPSAASGGAEAKSNPLIDVLTARLTEQSKGISTSASSELQSSIEAAIKDTKKAGESTAARLQSERQREVAYAEDRAASQFTSALEGRSGYATQVAGLRELTETTTKSIRDLDQRYQEAIMTNDANTASALAGLRLQKLEFLQRQEENFYSQLLGVANLQQEAIGQQQQNEQFWAAQDNDKKQFALGLLQSNYQFEKNYGLSLKDMDLKTQQLELERERNQISWAQYNLEKKKIEEKKSNTMTTAIIANDMKNKLQAAGDAKISKQQMLTPQYLMELRDLTGFEGSVEELSTIVDQAYGQLASDKKFMAQYLGAPQPQSYGTSRSTNAAIQIQNNNAKAQYDADRGVTIQSPESFWSNLFK